MFFTPINELNMALHEMWEVSNLYIGSKPYEEYFPCAEELAQLEKDEPALYETYRELMCHSVFASTSIYPSRGYINNLKSWVEYLFPVMDGPLENLQTLVADRQIAKAIKAGGHEDIVLEEDDCKYERGDTFLSFHFQASRLISRMTLLAGYLSAWLKRCVIPSLPHDGITPLLILPIIQLVHRHSLSLLPAMICRIHNGLRKLTDQFCKRVTTTKESKELIFPHDGPSPRVEMMYA